LGEEGPTYLFAGGVGEAGAELLHEGDHERVASVQEEELLGSDDHFDVVQVDDDGALAAQDDGRVGQHRVQQAQVAGWKVRSPHDHMLPHLQILVMPQP
jgi:hypothetical protein